MYSKSYIILTLVKTFYLLQQLSYIEQRIDFILKNKIKKNTRLNKRNYTNTRFLTIYVDTYWYSSSFYDNYIT